MSVYYGNFNILQRPLDSICKERVRGAHRRGTARPHVVLPGLRVPKALCKGGADPSKTKIHETSKTFAEQVGV